MPLIIRNVQGAISINGEVCEPTDQSPEAIELAENALVDTVGAASFDIASQASPSNKYAEVRGDNPWKVKVVSALALGPKQVYPEREPILFLHQHCCGCDGFYELLTQDGSVRIGMK